MYLAIYIVKKEIYTPYLFFFNIINPPQQNHFALQLTPQR